MAFAAGSSTCSSSRVRSGFQTQRSSAVLPVTYRAVQARGAAVEPVTEGSPVPVLNIIPESQVRNQFAFVLHLVGTRYHVQYNQLCM